MFENSRSTSSQCVASHHILIPILLYFYSSTFFQFWTFTCNRVLLYYSIDTFTSIISVLFPPLLQMGVPGTTYYFQMGVRGQMFLNVGVPDMKRFEKNWFIMEPPVVHVVTSRWGCGHTVHIQL